MSEPLILEIRCIFCKRIHRSEFHDVIEEEIMACRDQAPKWQRGDLDEYDHSETRPITVETSAYLSGYI